MVLEATVICIDNSEWMRNGDYPPTRFQAQADAINLICGAKTQANPENTVGLLTLAGKGVRVLVTPTSDLGKILSSMHGVEVEGAVNLPSGVQVAQLALKHRQNKNQRQRIVLFAGSPINVEKGVLVRIGKKLKKNNVAVDIINYGEEDDGKLEKLQSFLEAVNSNDNSHLVTVPPGPQILSDVLISSPVFTGDGEGGSGFAAAAAAGAAAAAAAGAGGDAGGFDFGVDPNLDPELALALRVSMEEERARQERAAREATERAATEQQEQPQGEGQGEAAGEEGKAEAEVEMAEALEEGSPDGAVAAATTAGGSGVTARGGHDGPAPMDEEQALLQQALAMSMAEELGRAPAGSGTADAGEDAELALALQMSMQESESGAQQGGEGSNVGSILEDPAFVHSVISSLPGVDPNDASLRDVLASLGGEEPRESKDKEEDKGADKKAGGK